VGTLDGQATIRLEVGTFIGPPDQTAVRVRIAPLNPQPPPPSDIVMDGNAYVIDARFVPSDSGPVVPQLPFLINLRYSAQPPDGVYRIEGKTWTPIGGTVQPTLLTVEAHSAQGGTFAPAHQLAGSAGPIRLDIIVFLVGAIGTFLVLLLLALNSPIVRRRLRGWRKHRDPDDWIT
jgi:hypothetical protein